MTKQAEVKLFTLLGELDERLKKIEHILNMDRQQISSEAVPGDVKFHIPALLRGLMKD